MPKRAKTPPPAWDSEPTYFVVYQPYPINANMELSADRMRFAFWLACALGDPSHLFALFHKPSSPGMIIIEVNKSFTPHSSLLGAHQWSAILRAPARDEAERASKIYYCKYNTARQVEKAGWKRKMVEEAWFSKWRLDNSVITHPYPPTHACALPAETVTTEGLCRPLPVRLFPRPPVPASRLPPREWCLRFWLCGDGVLIVCVLRIRYSILDFGFCEYDTHFCVSRILHPLCLSRILHPLLHFANPTPTLHFANPTLIAFRESYTHFCLSRTPYSYSLPF
ncbi:hypothetical protein NEOLEDRAFT_1137890 [Neolentinus lepideus HHB14362 ss-1]|uniref:Uncharacterized protein n=1 Tax=Neolentinus lepideus HHB14362 ss-1 TaxID=1314782 RepID=A0A165QHR3_9AGAM|nr:hypothetical protein NEOLEDRAFT_1137890 [Neolentinus lepideus HHB14362 ss-1]